MELSPRWWSALVALFLVTALLTTSGSASAADGARLRWRRQAGIGLADVAVDRDGSIVVVGSRSSPSGGSALLVKKLTPAGQPIWSRTWRPMVTRAWGAGVAVGPDGSIYVVGELECRHVEGSGMFVRAYGPGGQPRWTRMTAGIRSPRCRALSVVEGAVAVAAGSGLVVVAGQEHGCCGLDLDDAWVRTYSYGGRLLWSRDIEAPGITGTNDSAGDIAIGGLGRIFFVGDVEMRPNQDTATLVDHSILIQKLAPGGALIWSRVLRDRHGKDRDRATGVAVRADRLIVTAVVDGGRGSPPSAGHAWLARFTFGGDLVWKRTWGTAPHFHDAPTAVSIGPSGRLVVLGERGSRMFVRRLSPSGIVRWTTVLRGPLAWLVSGGVVDTATGPVATGAASGPYRDNDVGYVWRWVG
jgi:hypothetical protein